MVRPVEIVSRRGSLGSGLSAVCGARALLGAALLGGCIVPQARFSPEIQRAINRDDMRRLETERLVLYYPEGARPAALQIASRLEYCRRELERAELIRGGPAADKLVALHRMGVRHVVALMNFGLMPAARVEQAMERLVREVLPRATRKLER